MQLGNSLIKCSPVTVLEPILECPSLNSRLNKRLTDMSTESSFVVTLSVPKSIGILETFVKPMKHSNTMLLLVLIHTIPAPIAEKKSFLQSKMNASMLFNFGLKIHIIEVK